MSPTYRFNAQRDFRHGRALTSLLTLLVIVGSIVGGGYWYAKSRPQSNGIQAITHQVSRGQFIHTVVEQGEVESSVNVEIRCEVKSRNSGGIAILEVVDEGTIVEAGDIVAKLDSSALEQDVVQQQIVCNTTEATMIQARNTFDAAKIALKEYVDGTFHQEKQLLQGEILLAEENLRRAREYVRYSERLAARGYATSQQLEGDRFAVEKAESELDAAKIKLRVLEEYTKPKMTKQLESDIKTAEAQWKSELSSYDLEKTKLAEIEQEIEKCTLRAPKTGQVVHANEQSRRGNDDFIVEPGALVREGQAIIRLPDPARMQVKAKINESRVTLVRAGMPAKIRLDAYGDELLPGVVTRVNEYPEPTSWYSSQVKEYATFVKIDASAMDRIKPGLTAEVQIQVAAESDVPQVPVQAVHEHGRQTFCLVRNGDQWEPREIKIIGNNDQFVTTEGSIQENEIVAMNPRALLTQVTLPEPQEEPPMEQVAMATTTKPSASKPTSGPPSGRPGGGSGGFDPAAIVNMTFQKMDKNKDGQLSSDEIPADRADRFRRSDTNGDGSIGKDEMLQAMKKMMSRGGASGGNT